MSCRVNAKKEKVRDSPPAFFVMRVVCRLCLVDINLHC